METNFEASFAGEGVKYEITENNFILINPSTKNEKTAPSSQAVFAKEEFSARCSDRREWRTYYRCERS